MARKQITRDFKFSESGLPEREETPQILQQHRSRAWKTYQVMDFPSSQDEAWRRTSLRDLKLEKIHLPNGKTSELPRRDIRGRILADRLLPEENAAVLWPGNVDVQLSQQTADQGVIFTDLISAGREHPQLVEKVLGKVVDPQEGKFAAAAAAFAENGLFLYVPRGVQVAEPLTGLSYTPGEQTANFSQLLIYLEEGASLTYFHEAHSPDLEAGQSLTGENLEIFVGQNASLKFVDLQTYSEQTWSFGHKKALVERDGSLDWVIAAVGSHLSKHFVSVDLVGPGAEGRIAGLFFAGSGQHLSYNTLQRHLAPRTISDLLFKGGLTGNSRSVWRGMIYVAPGAQYIDGYQANRNLILSDSARSDSIPGLEILNNDVRCTHGSTVGKIDQEQLFYLRSRGIPKPQAEQIVIQGFFEAILSRVDFPAIEERLWEVLEQKITSR